jgi:GT2 family glycosyltransferase
VDKTNTLWVSGGSGAFRKSIWEKLGGLNELYAPFYWEDIDLSYRAIKSGYEVLFESKSVVVHEHEQGAIRNKYSEFKIKTTAYKNQFIFVWENITDFPLRVSHIAWLPYHFAKALVASDWAFYLGFLEALILLPKIIKSSLSYQKLFIRKDKQILASYKE